MKGQVAIFVLLISALIMTVGLSVAKRTVIETKIDTDEELLKQAFNAAESGIDTYLLDPSQTGYSSTTGSSAEIEVDNIGDVNDLSFEETILENKSAFLWLRDRGVGGSLNYSSGYDDEEISLCLTDTSGGNFEGSLKVDYFYLDEGEIKVSRAGYNLSGTTEVIGYENMESNCADYELTGTPLLLALTPILGSAKMSVSGDDSFPIQGERITSTGSAGEVESAPVLRKVTVVNQYQIPYFMLEAVTAKGNISN